MILDRAGTAAKLSEKLDMSKKQAKIVVDTFIDVVATVLTGGNVVKFINFGKFFIESRPKRIGRNPSNGAPIEIPAHRIVRFKPGKGLKAKVK